MMHTKLLLGLLWLQSLTMPSALAGSKKILIQGAPLIGGSNGMYFDGNNYLHVAQVYGRTISKLDIDSGKIIDKLSYAAEPNDLVMFPDDLIFGPDGTMYYTDPQYYQTVFARPPGGPSIPLLPVGSVPFANSVTLSEDGRRLFYAQCWDTKNGNSLFELNLDTLESKVILRDIFGCASNAMDYKDNALYTPRPFEGRVVKVDLTSSPPIVTNVTTGLVAPNAVKFNSKQELYVVDDGKGEIDLIDLTASDTDKNQKLIARFQANSMDNLAFDKDDRLFVSSTAAGSVTEILPGGELSTISSEGMSMPMGLAVIEDTHKLYTVHPGALYEIDLEDDARLNIIATSAVTLGPMPEPTSVVAWGRDLILIGSTSDTLVVWDLESQSAKMKFTVSAPADAHPFNGDLIVTESSMGSIVRTLTHDKFQKRQNLLQEPDAVFLFLTGDDNDVYVSDWSRGLVLQIITNQSRLVPPRIVADDLSYPEGIAMHPNGKEILVLETGTKSLLAVDLSTGDKRVIVGELELMPGVEKLPFGYPYDVVVLNGTIYVNGDGANVIYSITDDEEHKEEEPPSAACQKVTNALFVFPTAVLFCMPFLNIFVD